MAAVLPARWLVRLVVVVLAFAAGGLLAWKLLAPPRFDAPPAPVVVQQVRTAARLETLDVRVYKKVSFAPSPEPTGSVWGDLASWVKHTVSPPRGRAIVFAVVHYGVDLSKLSADAVRVTGARVEVVLPPVQAKVELLPGETEVIDSNLDSAQTAELFELARRAFETEAGGDAALKSKARAAAELAVDRVVRALGFKDVAFVDALSGGGTG